MKYRVKTLRGPDATFDDINYVLGAYCKQHRNCAECRMSWRNQPDPLARACSPDLGEDEILRRLGDEIEVIHDEPETSEEPLLAQSDDHVNHPAHYTAGGIECIDAIAAALTCQRNPMQAWLTGQVLKYLWRWPMKNGGEDLEKARFYLNRLIDNVKTKA